MSAGAANRGLGSQPGAGLRYGLLGLPLAFVALPLYVLLPRHYSETLGVPLAALGVLLLAVRGLDAVVDPLIGRWVDRLLTGTATRLAVLATAAAALLALCFHALMFPPVRGEAALLAWGAVMLLGCYGAYSGLTVLHQAWGAQLGGAPADRARVVAWREGLALAGVLLASVLPGLAGLGATSAALAAALVLGLVGLAQAPRPVGLDRLGDSAPAPDPRQAPSPPCAPAPALSLWAPLAHTRFRRLLIIYLLNGVASALPATLVLFFIRDRLQAPAMEPLFLGSYFASAALSLPLWVRGVARFGLARCWAAGMGLAVVSFLGAASLGAGDSGPYLLICVASGLALGADLSAPPALLAGLLQDDGLQGQAEGRYFGWWNLATKLNLALAAGVALPLLQALGYQPGAAPDSPQAAGGLQALALVYGLLPCGLKLLAAFALWRLWLRKETP